MKVTNTSKVGIHSTSSLCSLDAFPLLTSQYLPNQKSPYKPPSLLLSRSNRFCLVPLPTETVTRRILLQCKGIKHNLQAATVHFRAQHHSCSSEHIPLGELHDAFCNNSLSQEGIPHAHTYQCSLFHSQSGSKPALQLSTDATQGVTTSDGCQSYFCYSKHSLLKAEYFSLCITVLLRTTQEDCSA